MSAPVGSIINKFFQSPSKPLNILCCPCHERFESCVAKTGHNFYAIRTNQVKDWNETYAPVPVNYNLLDKNKVDQIPVHMDYDVVFCQNKFGQFQLLQNIARQLHLPMICLEHTQPVKEWSKEELAQFTNMKGDVNVFISNHSRSAWGFADNGIVISHGIDTELFKPSRKCGNILTVANEYKQRDYFLGYRIFEQVARQIKIRLVGDNKDLGGFPARTVEELANEYGQASIFFNTSQVSPIPMSLLEAMSSGCICVSTRTCEIPNIIKHGENGLLYDTPEEAAGMLQYILADPENLEFKRLGAAARQTILNDFSLEAFVKNWDMAFRKAAGCTYLG